MEKTSERIEPILLQAERDLRVVIADAAKVGDYEGVDLAREVAARIKAMLSLVGDRISPVQNGKVPEPPRAAAAMVRAGRTGKAGKRREYPKFSIRKGILSKVGWSKKAKREYTHKIPREAYGETIRAIETLKQNGVSPLTADQIVEQTELAGNPVPIYQVYVALAFLREGDIVRREGRDGYVVVPEFGKRAEGLWSEA